MGSVWMPQIGLYWTQETRYLQVADVLSRNKFYRISQVLHFNNNALVVVDRDFPHYDSLHKNRPFLFAIRQNCLTIENEKHQSIDEQLIPFKGKNKLRQYLQKKPKKLGFKVFARCYVSGIIYDFEFNEVKSPATLIPLPVSIKNYQAAKFVWRLVEELPQQVGHKVCFDNFFTFVELQLELMAIGICCVGTVRSNRLRDCLLKTEKQL